MRGRGSGGASRRDKNGAPSNSPMAGGQNGGAAGAGRGRRWAISGGSAANFTAPQASSGRTSWPWGIPGRAAALRRGGTKSRVSRACPSRRACASGTHPTLIFTSTRKRFPISCAAAAGTGRRRGTRSSPPLQGLKKATGAGRPSRRRACTSLAALPAPLTASAPACSGCCAGDERPASEALDSRSDQQGTAAKRRDSVPPKACGPR